MRCSSVSSSTLWSSVTRSRDPSEPTSRVRESPTLATTSLHAQVKPAQPITHTPSPFTHISRPLCCPPLPVAEDEAHRCRAAAVAHPGVVEDAGVHSAEGGTQRRHQALHQRARPAMRSQYEQTPPYTHRVSFPTSSPSRRRAQPHLGTYHPCWSAFFCCFSFLSSSSSARLASCWIPSRTASATSSPPSQCPSNTPKILSGPRSHPSPSPGTRQQHQPWARSVLSCRPTSQSGTHAHSQARRRVMPTLSWLRCAGMLAQPASKRSTTRRVSPTTTTSLSRPHHHHHRSAPPPPAE